MDDAERVSNVKALEADFETAVDAVDEVAERVMAVPAHTAEDFAFKARILRDWIWPDLKDPDLFEDNRQEVSVVRDLNDALALIGGEALAAA